MDLYSALAFAMLGFLFALPIAALLVVGLRRGHVRALADHDHHQITWRPEIGSDDPRIEQLGQRLIDTGLSGLPSRDQTMIINVIAPRPSLRNANQTADAEETFGDHTADQVAGFGGPWKFILLFIAGLALWVTLNTVVLVTAPSRFDAYPFVFLNLILSMVAALQAPIILMSQNRQAKRPRQGARRRNRGGRYDQGVDPSPTWIVPAAGKR